jgi:hypothetical protein
MVNNFLLKPLFVYIIIAASISCSVKRSSRTNIDVTGNWQVKISVAGDTILGKCSLSQNGKNVTGWVGPSETDPIPVTGMFKDGKLIIRTLPQPGRTVAFDKVELKVDADTMYGDIENGSHGKGNIKFTRSK